MNFNFIFNEFVLFLTALGLHCYMQNFSSCAARGLLFTAVRGFLISLASLVAEPGLLGEQVSAVAAHRLSCPAVCAIFPDQGSNPCLLSWQVDSQPLNHQGGPTFASFMTMP